MVALLLLLQGSLNSPDGGGLAKESPAVPAAAEDDNCCWSPSRDVCMTEKRDT
jgi:hypothetical protein